MLWMQGNKDVENYWSLSIFIVVSLITTPDRCLAISWAVGICKTFADFCQSRTFMRSVVFGIADTARKITSFAGEIFRIMLWWTAGGFPLFIVFVALFLYTQQAEKEPAQKLSSSKKGKPESFSWALVKVKSKQFLHQRRERNNDLITILNMLF
jgi:uncharacterized ion transporter superfamily protein YfcC